MARRRLPPLNALRAFEAFSRRGSMTAAAEELYVTHGAVSRQVKQLEDALGVVLVEGPRNRLRLTEEGARLAASLTTAFDAIERGLPEAAPRGAPLEVSCLATFAMKWLIPRLPDFIARHPDIPVRISESHEPCDFRRSGTDLAIRVSYPQAGEGEATRFLKQYHGPVLSPALLAAKGASLASLSALPRLFPKTFPQAWSDWQAKMGVSLGPPPLEREFEHNFSMLEAAAAGLGVAIGPWAFAMPDIAAGRLAAPLGFVATAGDYVALRPEGVRNPASAAFRDWLVEQGATTPDPPLAAPLGLAPPADAARFAP